MESSRKLADGSEIQQGCVRCVAVPQEIGVISLSKSNKTDRVVENVRQASLTRRMSDHSGNAFHTHCTSGSKDVLKKKNDVTKKELIIAASVAAVERHNEGIQVNGPTSSVPEAHETEEAFESLSDIMIRILYHL
ncbi:hypothetical protein PILCRDRAFT_14914 [Piloderma croceum F 1598]|uniref:Uncharacterized protein n=1 Tax=Piloderma croceum (strain F 1598) TaxID=765440 RepID=A0A0C3AJ13_PILCF|nr:hypothetical protein PILCRDRAFT_14914 [Piloderma croceum F 1598]